MRRLRNPLDVKEGDLYRSGLDGKVDSVSRVKQPKVMLDSVSGENRIVTEIELLKTESFYRRLDAK